MDIAYMNYPEVINGNFMVSMKTALYQKHSALVYFDPAIDTMLSTSRKK